MRIIFVRHGHPNYKDDCLTELGHLQAEAAAERLSREKIVSFYSSSCGRAVETAEHIAARFQAPVTQLDFMREIRWKAIDDEPLAHNGNPWLIADDLVREGHTLHDPDWAQKLPFSRSVVGSSTDKVAREFDHWLAQFGYVRHGEYYRVQGGNHDTILLASHAGASGAVIAHILNLPFPFVCKAMGPNFTAITVVEFTGEEGDLVCPELVLMNDARHIQGIETENFFGN